MYVYMLDCRVARVGRWTTTHDAPRPPASFDSQIDIDVQHINKPRLVSKLNVFQTFLNFLRNFKMRGDGNHDDRHDDEQV
jgi:hypothetical protein